MRFSERCIAFMINVHNAKQKRNSSKQLYNEKIEWCDLCEWKLKHVARDTVSVPYFLGLYISPQSAFIDARKHARSFVSIEQWINQMRCLFRA